jgi:hypothetical protein
METSAPDASIILVWQTAQAPEAENSSSRWVGNGRPGYATVGLIASGEGEGVSWAAVGPGAKVAEINVAVGVGSMDRGWGGDSGGKVAGISVGSTDGG